MAEIKLLDCTLRDGGFINDWNFGLNVIRNIIYRLNRAKVDIIELGFLDDRRPSDSNSTILPRTKDFNHMLRNLNISDSMLVAMIDYGTCALENIEPCEQSCIDGLRVIFKKHMADDALIYCSELQKKGYKVFVQPVSITSYSDEEMLALVNKVNELNPFGMSIVDTYGLLIKKELLHFYNLINDNLDEKISIGYHAHNNFQLAFANCIELLEIAGDRNLLLDSSIYGMGKGAGNTNTEMLALYMNQEYSKNYDIDQFLEIIDVDIMSIYQESYWGYSLLFYLSASNDCHPTYVKYLLDKKTLSIKSINILLSRIEEEKKLAFNQDLIDMLYFEYQTHEVEDSEAIIHLKADVKNKPILILAAGSSIETNRKEIQEFIQNNDPLIFSVNFIAKEYPLDYVFVNNVKRYRQFLDSYFMDLGEQKQSFKIMATSNITQAEVPVDFYFNYSNLLNKDKRVIDNSTLLLINLLKKIGVKELYIAGFDGFFKKQKPNFAYSYLDFTISNESKKNMNAGVGQYLKEQSRHIDIKFLAPSAYLDYMKGESNEK